MRFSLGLFGATLIICLCCLFTRCGYSRGGLAKEGDGGAARWYADRHWMEGVALTPDESINRRELYEQYQKNKIYWQEAFRFLKERPLATLKPGEYVIDPGNVIATVVEGKARQKEQIDWEAHRDFNDIQYIIKGAVLMGVGDISDTANTVLKPYSAATDIENFRVRHPRYYVARPDRFFIFSPKEIHQPAIWSGDLSDSVKKVVIKVRARA